MADANTDMASFAVQKGRPLLSDLSQIPRNAVRAIVIDDSADFDMAAAVEAATRILSRNRKGYFRRWSATSTPTTSGAASTGWSPSIG